MTRVRPVRQGLPDRLERWGRVAEAATALGIAVALLYAVFFQALYYITILRSTTDDKLQATR